MEENLSSEDLLFMMKRISTRLTAQIETRLGQKTMTGVQVYLSGLHPEASPKRHLSDRIVQEIGISKSTLSALDQEKWRRRSTFYPYGFRGYSKEKCSLAAKLIGEGDQLLREVDQMESELSFSGLNPQEKKQLWDLKRSSSLSSKWNKKQTGGYFIMRKVLQQLRQYKRDTFSYRTDCS